MPLTSTINQIVKFNRYNNISVCCKEPAILLRQTIITRSTNPYALPNHNIQVQKPEYHSTDCCYEVAALCKLKASYLYKEHAILLPQKHQK